MSKRDGVYRAMLRGESTHVHRVVAGAAQELATAGLRAEPGRNTLLETRREIMKGWQTVADILDHQQPDLAILVRRFARAMPPPRTEKEIAAEGIVRHMRVQEMPERSVVR